MNKDDYKRAMNTDSDLELERIMYKNGYNLPEINKWPEELRKRYEALTADQNDDFNVMVDYF